MIGAGAVAALTVIGAGLVRFPVTADDPVASVGEGSAAKSEAKAGAKNKNKAGAKTQVKRPVKYVRLKPGQKAPKGAKVIREAAPTPRIVVRRSAPSTQQSSVRVVTKTKQSG